jgi:hypothetical protein
MTHFFRKIAVLAKIFFFIDRPLKRVTDVAFKFMPGANPMIVSYNASVVVKIYSSTSSLVCFGNKNIYFYYEKRFVVNF